jgi:putative SOS response-associated peptidase YedK
MCGRFDCHSAISLIAETFGAYRTDIQFGPDYNVAFSQHVLISSNKGNRKLLAADGVS